MERMVIEYRIVRECDKDLLTELVNRLIKEGWQPQGGLAADEFHVYQAMVLFS